MEFHIQDSSYYCIGSGRNLSQRVGTRKTVTKWSWVGQKIYKCKTSGCKYDKFVVETSTIWTLLPEFPILYKYLICKRSVGETMRNKLLIFGCWCCIQNTNAYDWFDIKFNTTEISKSNIQMALTYKILKVFWQIKTCCPLNDTSSMNDACVNFKYKINYRMIGVRMKAQIRKMKVC